MGAFGGFRLNYLDLAVRRSNTENEIYLCVRLIFLNNSIYLVVKVQYIDHFGLFFSFEERDLIGRVFMWDGLKKTIGGRK